MTLGIRALLCIVLLGTTPAIYAKGLTQIKLDNCLAYSKRLAIAHSPRFPADRLDVAYNITASEYDIHRNSLERYFPELFHFYRIMGFEFPSQLQISSLTYRDFEQHYARYMAKLVKDGVIAADRAIRPGAFHYSPEGKKVIVKLSDAAFSNTQKRSAPKDNNPKEFHSIHDEILAVAAGFFPMGLNEYFVHDLAHLATFANFPTYMAAYRDMAIKYANKEFPEIFISNNESSPAVVAFKNRYFAVNEGLVLFNPKTLSQTLQDLQIKIPEWDLNHDPEIISKMKSYILTQVESNPAWLDQAISKIVSYYDKNSKRLGGVIGDAYNLSEKIKHYDYFNQTQLSTSPAFSLEYVNFLRDSATREQKIEALSKLYTWAIVGHQNPDPASWAIWIFDPKAIPTIQNLLRANGLMGKYPF